MHFCLYCTSMSMLHTHSNTASKSMLHFRSMPHAQVHAACPSPCCMSKSMLHVQFHAACPSPCCISKSMPHVQVHTTCPCCKSMLMLHVDVHAACLCPCYNSMLMLHIQVHAELLKSSWRRPKVAASCLGVLLMIIC
jgi:hypothetical protein